MQNNVHELKKYGKTFSKLQAILLRDPWLFAQIDKPANTLQVGECQSYGERSLCLIKPHAVLSSKVGAIITRIQESFSITAMQTCQFDMCSAGGLLELYRYFLPLSEFTGMVEELCSGELNFNNNLGRKSK